MDLKEYIDYQHKFYQACEVADSYIESSLSGALDAKHSQHFLYRALKCEYCKQNVQNLNVREKEELQDKWTKWAKNRIEYIMKGIRRYIPVDEVFEQEILKEYSSANGERKQDVAKYLYSLDSFHKQLILVGLYCEMIDIIYHLHIEDKVFDKDEEKPDLSLRLKDHRVVSIALDELYSMTDSKLKEMACKCPVNIINTLYYIKNTISFITSSHKDYISKTDNMISKVRAYLLQNISGVDEYTTDAEIQNMMYGLTHVVIGASDFYMKKAMNVQLESNIIADWLQKGLNFRNNGWLTDDLMCECAVVLKCVGLRPDLVHKAYARMTTKVKKKESLLPANAKEEHTASLYLLASPLYEGIK